MHPDDFPKRALQIEALHATWCGLTRTNPRLTHARIAAWNGWLDHNPRWGANELLTTAVWLRGHGRKIEFSELIQQPDNFATLLAEARQELRLRPS